MTNVEFSLPDEIVAVVAPAMIEIVSQILRGDTGAGSPVWWSGLEWSTYRSDAESYVTKSARSIAYVPTYSSLWGRIYNIRHEAQ